MAIRGFSERADFGLFPSNGGATTPISLKPFTDVDLDDPDSIREWILDTSQELSSYYAPWRRLFKDNIQMYVGGSQTESVSWLGESSIRQSVSSPKASLIRPIIESHLSRLTSSRAHVSVLPVKGGDFESLSAAKNASDAIESLFEERKMTVVGEKVARTMLVCGSAYAVVEWDNDIGPRLPEVEEGIPIFDDKGEVQLDEEGKPIMIKGAIRAGDVNIRPLRPDQVLEQPSEWGRAKDWIITMELWDVYKLRERFPTVATEIHPTESPADFGENLLLNKSVEKQTLVFTLYHRATPSFPNGKHIICTADTILENSDLMFPTLNEYGLIPVVRLCDMEVPGYALPLPLTVMEAGKPYQNLYNKLASNIHKNLSLQTPKWMVPQASGVRASDLDNSANVVIFRGQAPELKSPATTSPEIYNYRNEIINEMQIATGSSHMLNVPPPNTRAATMLDHQEEQEFRRAEPLIRHMNDFLADVAKICLAVMADKYADIDERVVKLMGNKGAGAFMRMKTRDLVGPFDVRFERTSALPESKQGRLNEAARLFSLGMLSADQYKTVIGYNADPELADANTKAFEKQLLETEKMIRGMEVQPPVQHEDHVQHLKALYPVLQSAEFAVYPGNIQQQIVSHIMAHEMFAWQRAQVSMTYAMKVAEHVQFCCFTELPKALPVAMGNPATPLDGTIQQRLASAPMPQSSGVIEPPGPGNPAAV